MRVAFIHSGYSRHLMSGIIRVETELVLALRRQGHVAEIMPWPEDQRGPLVQQQYLRIVRPASLVYRAVRDFIIAGQYDIVVFQGVGYPETRALPWLKRETKAKFIIVQHGWLDHSPAARFLVNSYMQTVGHMLLAEADAVVAVSHYIKSHLATYTDADQVSVIYPGVDTRSFAPTKDLGAGQTNRQAVRGAVNARFGLTQKNMLIANGKLAAHKNIATILRALQRIPDTSLIVVGSGSKTKETYYRELALSLGVSGRTRFVGTVANDQLPELYNAADLLVHGSRSEALGIVLLEALACGVPVVAPQVGGIPEVVVSGFNGTLISDPKDDGQMAGAITALLQSPQQRRQFGEQGRAFVAARFDWSVILPQYLRLFSRIAAQERVDEEQPSDGLFGAFA